MTLRNGHEPDSLSAENKTRSAATRVTSRPDLVPAILSRLAAPAETTCYRYGLNEVEQRPVRLPLTTETDTVTLYPGVAPLM